MWTCLYTSLPTLRACARACARHVWGILFTRDTHTHARRRADRCNARKQQRRQEEGEEGGAGGGDNGGGRHELAGGLSALCCLPSRRKQLTWTPLKMQAGRVQAGRGSKHLSPSLPASLSLSLPHPFRSLRELEMTEGCAKSGVWRGEAVGGLLGERNPRRAEVRRGRGVTGGAASG